MSTRPLPEDRNDAGQYSSDVATIENIAEAKGVDEDIEDIDVYEDENSDGDTVVTFRIYTEKVLTDDGGVDEEQSVGTQVTKMPSLETAGNTFRNNVQNTLSALKRYLSGDDGQSDVTDELEEAADETSSTTSSKTTDVDYDDVDIDADSPGATIDAQLVDKERRLQSLEQRVEELEEYVEALEGLQQLMGDSSE